MLFEKMLQMLEQYGALAILSAFTCYFGWRYFDNKMQLIEIRVNTELSDHSLFPFLTSCIKTKIPVVKMEDENRKKVAVAFLKIKFSVFRKHLLKIAEMDIANMTDDKIKKVNMEVLTEATIEYENKCKELNMPAIFIEKFAQWHDPHVEMVMEGVKGASHSSFHGFQTTKQSAIFDIYKIGFHMTLIDAEKTLESLNGKLTEWINSNQQTIESWKKLSV